MPKIPDAAVIEIVEKTNSESRFGVIVPNEVRINGIPLLVPEGDSVVVHEMPVPIGNDVVKVTLTLFAKRVTIGAEVSEDA